MRGLSEITSWSISEGDTRLVVIPIPDVRFREIAEQLRQGTPRSETVRTVRL